MMKPNKIHRNKVFISYCRRDVEWLKRLQVHLRHLEQDYDIEIWDDTKINSGDKWREGIREAIEFTKVAVLLVSADFLASDFITTNELPPLLKAAEEEGAIILPVIVSPSRFSRINSLAQFQAINPTSAPLIGMNRSEQEAVFVKLLDRIEAVLPINELDAPTIIGSRTTPLRIRKSRKALDSLAILPLVNASGDTSLEYLGDGITETIINRLSKLPKLKVMARSTVFRYKDRQVDPQQVGYDLNVRAVLTGRVLLLGNKLIISTELVDVADGSQLWGKQYNREISDIFAIGGEISKEISNELELKLTGEERKRLTKRYTKNSEAYQLYLKGRYFLNKFFSQTIDIRDLKSAEDLFEKSIEVDSNFALAHSSLGVCYLNHVLKGLGGINYYPKARKAFDRALTIDSKLIEPRTRMVYISLFEGRSEAARQEVRRLLRIAPNEAHVHAVAAYVYRLSGRYEQALNAYARFLEISPTDVVYISYNRARIYIYQHNYEEAEAEIAKGLVFEPLHPNLQAYLAIIDYYRGKIEKATMMMEECLAKNPHFHGGIKLFLAYCYLARCDRERAFALIDNQVIETAYADQDIAYRLATVYALNNQPDEAIEWLERAISMGNENYPWFTMNPNWKGLIDNTRYKSLLENLKTKWENCLKQEQEKK
jgi:TolB-like protein/Tfp pilus assembly protein PilF